MSKSGRRPNREAIKDSIKNNLAFFASQLHKLLIVTGNQSLSWNFFG